MNIHRILVVDGSPANADALSGLLGQIGHDADVAHDGYSALKVAATLRPNVVFIDLALPVMTGFDLARELRARGSKAALVALTGHTDQEAREKAEVAGFDHYILKPATLDRLLMILSMVRPATA